MDIKEIKGNLGIVDLGFELDSIPGWLTKKEAAALFLLGKHFGPRILEIGSWAGKSTVSISKGVVASDEQKSVTTIELNPSFENFPERKDGSYDFVFEGAPIENVATVSKWAYENEIKPVISHPGGVVGRLEESLKANNINFVEILVGDFKTMQLGVYDVVFADTMHDEPEISTNAPFINALAKGIVAFHDCSKQNRKIIDKHFSIGEATTIDSLFIGRLN